jgi:hypothetical protein
VREASSDRRFRLPPDPRIVFQHHNPDRHPASQYRPLNQFGTARAVAATPVFVLGSIVTDPTSDLVDLTYTSLAQGSLSTWRWYILDMGTTDANALKLLKQLERSDPRVAVQRGEDGLKLAGGMNVLLEMMTASGASFGAFLQPYTMVEHTILEKSAWAFSSVPTWDIVGHFEAKADPGHSGLHSGAANLQVSSSLWPARLPVLIRFLC